MNNNTNSTQNGQPTVSLRDRREALGLTRTQVAIQARCSINTVAHIEMGVTRNGTAREKIIRILTELEQAA